ncbi:hypothetical protein RJ640_010438 [Escallonia rubra]|uniref:Endopeptidase S2P n=1 Tax=Escallonia rubra TaxID=112253 RepID=A0AA88RYN5_9ASTE|nr:hypothetical protein RJ640_010438 [Escallonia rubra]
MEVGRRMRRFGRGGQNTLLPLRVTHLSNTLSCWYCDFKSSAFNEPLFRLGRRHARCLRVWFSVGVGFSLTAVVGVTLILIWELAHALHLCGGNAQLGSILSGSFFGFPSSDSKLSISLADLGYMCVATIVSVSAHEFGHALAAASSEGIPIEYVAVFFAVLFPGALVAFNREMLQALPRPAALRVYSAGIWHNAALCAICALALLLLPLIFYPFYIHGESPMVLEVSSTSPFSGFLSPGDLIVSFDGVRIHSAKEWMEMTTLFDEQTFQDWKHNTNSKGLMRVDGKKGYCVPSSLVEKSKLIQLLDNQTTCAKELTAFETISCLGSSSLDDSNREDSHENRKSIHCLTAKDIVKLEKCGDGWVKTGGNKSSCQCSEEEYCLTPVQMPGLTWVEITYSRPYSPGCRQHGGKSFLGVKGSELGEMGCGGTFVFIGDITSMAHSIWLTAYQPRWLFSFGAYLPNLVEKLLMCTFHVSLTLVLLNSLPVCSLTIVYFLDGESILEVTLCFSSLLSPRQRRVCLESCLLGGTLVFIITSLRSFFLTIW